MKQLDTSCDSKNTIVMEMTLCSMFSTCKCYVALKFQVEFTKQYQYYEKS